MECEKDGFPFVNWCTAFGSVFWHTTCYPDECLWMVPFFFAAMRQARKAGVGVSCCSMYVQIQTLHGRDSLQHLLIDAKQQVINPVKTLHVMNTSPHHSVLTLLAGGGVIHLGCQ
jgi:hypothetical protein